MSSLIDFDAELSPEEVKRARKIVAWEELKETVVEYRYMIGRISLENLGKDSELWEEIKEVEREIIALVLELIPE